MPTRCSTARSTSSSRPICRRKPPPKQIVACPLGRDRLSATDIIHVVRRSSLGLLLCVLIAGCAAHKLAAPSPSPSGDQAPVTLRNLQIETVDGHRAVLV